MCDTCTSSKHVYCVAAVDSIIDMIDKTTFIFSTSTNNINTC